VKADWAFGHDLRIANVRIVDHTTGKDICEMIGNDRSAELAGRIVRSSPVFARTMIEAESRLSRARHPNAVSLRDLIRAALSTLEPPLIDPTDRPD